MLDIRPCNAEDVANILFLIKPHLERAECTQGIYASINVETRIRGLRWCWQMHGSYMTFRPDGFPNGGIEFRCNVYRSAEECSEYNWTGCPGIVSPDMVAAYLYVCNNRGHVGKNRVAAFFPELKQSVTEEFGEFEPHTGNYKPKRSWIAALLVALGLSSGCSLLPPGTECTGSIAFSERSHLLEGWPTGPRTEEDALTEVQIPVRCERGRTWVSVDLAYNLKGTNGGGFHGSAFTGGFSFGHKLWTYIAGPSQRFADGENSLERKR